MIISSFSTCIYIYIYIYIHQGGRFGVLASVKQKKKKIGESCLDIRKATHRPGSMGACIAKRTGTNEKMAEVTRESGFLGCPPANTHCRCTRRVANSCLRADLGMDWNPSRQRHRWSLRAAVHRIRPGPLALQSRPSFYATSA